MSKLRLDDVEWGEFKVSDVFFVSNSKAYHKESLEFVKKGISYITRTSVNNGLEGIVKDNKNFIVNPANSISLGAENADFFFHNISYISGNKMYCITNKNINKHIGIFLVNIFRSSIKNAGFGYGKGLTGTRFKNRKIIIPIDLNGNPNWQFMEDYIKQEMKEQAQKVVKYYENKLVKLGFELLDFEVEWKEFKIKEIFIVNRGKRHIEKNRIKGKIPYYSASSLNNGVTDFISNPLFKMKNKLLITTFCDSFYVDGEFTASDEINILSNNNLDKYNGLFIANIINLNKSKYTFGRKAFSERIKEQKIFLPIDKNGNPHWEYMSKFMKKLEKENISKVLEYIYIYIY